jgi:hypothetical protein
VDFWGPVLCKLCLIYFHLLLLFLRLPPLRALPHANGYRSALSAGHRKRTVTDILCVRNAAALESWRCPRSRSIG